MTAVGANGSQAIGASYDGSIVVGLDGSGHAVRWVDGIGVEDLGTLTGGWSQPESTSFNGNIVVGGSSTGTNTHAFRWANGAGAGSGNNGW